MNLWELKHMQCFSKQFHADPTFKAGIHINSGKTLVFYGMWFWK